MKIQEFVSQWRWLNSCAEDIKPLGRLLKTLLDKAQFTIQRTHYHVSGVDFDADFFRFLQCSDGGNVKKDFGALRHTLRRPRYGI